MKKKGQVWVETVIYTLIGLSLIGLILAFATPVIEKQRDRITLERTTETMVGIENNIESVRLNGPSSAEKAALTISKGNLIIDGENDKVSFLIDSSSYKPSEPGVSTEIGGTNIVMVTKTKGKKFSVTLTLDYSNKANLTFSGKDQLKTINPAGTSYGLMIENRGKPIGSSLTQVDFYLS